jgi:hypothetical protein
MPNFSMFSSVKSKNSDSQSVKGNNSNIIQKSD